MRTGQHRARRRSSFILMVVLALLTLFTILGITFVFLADSYATSARLAREAENLTRPDMEPELALAYVLGQLLYDLPDDSGGVQSALRGHSLARNLFGWDDSSSALNDKAFAGLGRLRYPSTAFPVINESDLLNYQLFAADGWVHDPERLGSRGPTQPRGPYVPGNVPYTYVDNNNAFLAFLNPATNRVEIPSFHRPWVFNLDPNTGQPLTAAPPFNDPTHPNWTSAVGKYLTLRPRPAEMAPGFPYPEDAGGDVKNYDGGPGGNDSIWLDVNFPVLLAPNGQKYKILIAPLLVELDSRINVNVHGNIGGKNNTHGGNQGWGPWEVNLGQVWPATQAASASPEWSNLFLGTPKTQRVLGRYGQGGLPLRPGGFNPTAGNPLLGPVARGWGARDDNGVVDPLALFGPAPTLANLRTPTLAYTLPTGFGSGFPNFPRSGYNNGYPLEYTSTGTSTGAVIHPLLYNPVHPASGNRAFSVADMVALLRSGGTNSEFLQSDLLRLCPANCGNARTRNLVTTASFDLDRPVPIAYVWDKDASPYQLNGAYPYSLQQPSITAPYSANQLADLVLARTGTLPQQTEFDPSWHSLLTHLDRLDLNRPLTSYPAPDPATGLIAAADLAQYDTALNDRQNLARDIFKVLREAVGARHPTASLQAAELNALRALAQIAVNIVDFIDDDDNITPFNWFGSEWVYGVELPRLVLNEVYVQNDNDPNDPGFGPEVPPPLIPRATTHYNVNVWVELLNPLDGTRDTPYIFPPAPPAFRNKDVEARLTSAAGPIYQVVVADPVINLTAMRDPANVTGDPDFKLSGGPSRVRAFAADFGPNPVVLPINHSYSIPSTSQKGFLVLGPQVAFLPGQDPNLPCSHQSPNMTYQVPVTAFRARLPARPALLLRRLACPGLPSQPDPALPRYNPFVTVDYVANTTPAAGNDARPYKNTGPNLQQQPMASRQALGRNQPYAAADTTVVPQQPLPALLNQPQHTFFRHNGQKTSPPTKSDATLNVPFDWLVHLDRSLISKAELLYVAGCKPHELTHLFVNGATANQHAAPWLDQTTRLFRFFELAGVHPLTSGVSLGGRVPGRININMVFDRDVFRAICDAEPGNLYNQTQVDAAFSTWASFRTPGGTPGANDKPFWGMGAGPARGNDALTAAARGLTVPLPIPFGSGTNPYQRFEMLNKFFNNITTRSNVFAVWLTVGFFEVVDDTTTPPRLGAEIGKAENRSIRHRMFAIVDRTNLQIFSTTSQVDVTGNPDAKVPVQLDQMSGIVDHSGFSWNVQPGSVLVYEPNDPLGKEETVVVQANNTATFLRSHPNGCQVISRGNPGPWTQQPYNPRRDTAVVPYFAVID